jgi:hypothetical protein
MLEQVGRGERSRGDHQDGVIRPGRLLLRRLDHRPARKTLVPYAGLRCQELQHARYSTEAMDEAAGRKYDPTNFFRMNPNISAGSR